MQMTDPPGASDDKAPDDRPFVPTEAFLRTFQIHERIVLARAISDVASEFCLTLSDLEESPDSPDLRIRLLDQTKEVVELLQALRRLVEGKSLPKAFGAPGDWGYSTSIGKALAALYRVLPSAKRAADA